jgi:DNA-binding NarL/FixJ family response regulator
MNPAAVSFGAALGQNGPIAEGARERVERRQATGAHGAMLAAGGPDGLDDKIRILIADDHPLVLGALRQALSSAIPGAEIFEAADLDSLSTALETTPEMDLVLLDLSMPGVRGFSGLMYLRAQHAGVPVIVVSANEDRAVMRHCLGFGASGYIPKSLDVETMRRAVRTVLDGGRWTPPDLDLTTPDESSALVRRLSSLTPQQVRVLMMLSQGLLNKQIAYALSVSEATIKAHVSAILQKLGVESRTQAVIAAVNFEKGQWPGKSP